MHIIYATDGSESAREGHVLLASLPLCPESRITVLSVAAREEGAAEELRYSEEVAREVTSETGAKAVARVRWGSPAEEILKESEESGADLIVVGARGQSNLARLLLGSVSSRVARHAPCSVLIARPLPAKKIATVLIGVDGSPAAHQGLCVLASIPLDRDCHMSLVSVTMPTVATAEAVHPLLVPHLADEVRALAQQARVDLAACLARSRQFLQAHGFRRITTRIRAGDPASEIVDAAAEAQADLLVVGARGISALDRFLLGSVSDRVLRHAHCSVLCVRPR
ncbi:MAG: universal stress protein [Armatimonadota bacterium]